MQGEIDAGAQENSLATPLAGTSLQVLHESVCLHPEVAVISSAALGPAALRRACGGSNAASMAGASAHRAIGRHVVSTCTSFPHIKNLEERMGKLRQRVP